MLEPRVTSYELRVTGDNSPGDSFDNRHSPIDHPRLDQVWRALSAVMDPEIPVISIVDMGMIAAVRVDGDHVAVDLTPTFVGCPALDVIRAGIHQALYGAGEPNARVNVVVDPPWNSDRITPEGRRKLKEFGLAPPACRDSPMATSMTAVACPYCESTNTQMESIFGPTLCRAIHYCHNCLQSFEQFKSL